MWAVTEVTNGSSDAVGVGTGQLSCDKPGHWGIGLQSQQGPEGFERGAGGPGSPGADATFHSRQTGSVEEQINPVPEIDGGRFVDEVGLTCRFAGGPQCCFGSQVCGSSIFDVGDRHKILPCSDLSQAAMAGCVEKFGDEVIVAGSPDQVRPQGAGEEAMLSGGIEDGLFGEGFGEWVVAEPAFGVWRGFVCIKVIGAIEDDAG